MIRAFRSKPLQALWARGVSAKVRPDLRERVLRRLDALDAAKHSADLAVPGFNVHPLRGKPQRYSIHVNGPWCLTFGWEGEDANDVDLENHH